MSLPRWSIPRTAAGLWESLLRMGRPRWKFSCWLAAKVNFCRTGSQTDYQNHQTSRWENVYRWWGSARPLHCLRRHWVGFFFSSYVESWRFDSDTKLTAKSLVSDITTHASTLINTPQGRRALFYLLVPRSRRHFTPAQIAIIAEIDSIRGKTSKKAADVREGEIRTAASEGLLNFVVDNGAEAARDTGGSLVVLDIMLHADGGWCISLDVPSFH